MNPYDYDAARLPTLKPACALIDTGQRLGTGFLINGARVLTCNHVTEDVTTVRCRFGDSIDYSDFRLLIGNAKSDLALIEAEDPKTLTNTLVPSVAPVTPTFTYWWSWGFPAIVDGQGVPLFGMVADPDSTDRNGRKIIQLFAENLAGEDAQLGGYSGSPVLSGTQVVAMIYRVLGDKTGGKRARFGMIYALPITSGGAPLGSTAAPGPHTSPLPPPDPTPTKEETEQLRLFGMLRSASTSEKLLEVLDAWRSEAKAALPPNVPLFAAEKLLAIGAPRSALAVLEGGETIRATQLRALAHSLLGKHDEARSLLVSLPPSGESGGISGGIFKRRYFETGKKAWLQGAFDEYERTFASSRDPYPGINAAATALWLGNELLSRRRALEVSKLLLAKPQSEWNHWDWATLGEAHLLRQHQHKALACYQSAVAAEPMHLRDISVMRRQARISLKKLGQPGDEFERVLSVGGVACFTGHRVDEPGRSKPRFPRDRVELVARRIREELDKASIHFGFSSAASGADLLFIEQLLARRGEPTVFLPFPQAAFAETSVGLGWLDRFNAALARIPPGNVRVLLERKPETSEKENEAYSRCNDEIQKAAIEAGQVYDEPPVLIAVLSSAQGQRPALLRGGTEEAVNMWREQVRGALITIDPFGRPANQAKLLEGK